MDETKVQIGEDVVLDIGTHSDWYISSIGYDGESVDVALRRKADRNKEWWLADTLQTERSRRADEQTMNDLDIMKSYCDKCKHKGTCHTICPTVWLAVLQRERSRR